MPDLLQHEAQAILTGTLGDDGVFYATELLLKCPAASRVRARPPSVEDHPGTGGHRRGCRACRQPCRPAG
ncbi:cytochrome c maturation protein CcmE [bacterium]|nr:cytochrome c maturation protein CcmE [bacterium]